MAALHWEARRRQMQVEERRLRQEKAPGAYPRQEILQEGKATEAPPPYRSLPPKPALQDATKPSCTCNTAHIQQHSGKLLNRHSSTEYVQQW